MTASTTRCSDVAPDGRRRRLQHHSGTLGPNAPCVSRVEQETRICLDNKELEMRAKRFLAVLFLTFLAYFAHAENIEVRAAAVALRDDGYALDVDFDIQLTPTVEDILAKGVALNFLLEFDLIRPRWYWLNDKVASVTQQYKLSYNSLTRQYRISLGTCSRTSRLPVRPSVSSAACATFLLPRSPRFKAAWSIKVRCACAWTCPSCRSRSRSLRSDRGNGTLTLTGITFR